MSSGEILFCYDGSDEARAAIEGAGSLLAERDAVVLLVTKAVQGSAAPIGTQSLAGSGASAEFVHAGTSASRPRLATARADHQAHEGAELARSAGFNARPLVRTADGHVWKTITEVAEEIGARAVVMGSRGRGALKGALLGSVSTSVVQHCACPVLVMRGAAPQS